MSKPCGVPDDDRYCEDPKDTEMGEGFCTRHSYEWRKSPEFQEAKKDERVIFAAQLGVKSMLTAALRPHKKRWLKRVGGEEQE